MIGTQPWPPRKTRIMAVGSGGGRPKGGYGGAASTATLASLSPSTAPHSVVGVAVTATGTGFKSGVEILVDGAAIGTTYLSTTQASGQVKPGAAGTRNVAVRNPGEVATATRPFTST